MEPTPQHTIFNTGIDEQSRAFLLETCRWGKLLSVLGIIFSVLMILGGLAFMALGTAFSDMSSMKGFGPAVGVIYLVLGALYLYPSWKLMRFSSDMAAGLNRGEQELVTSAFGSLKSSFRFWGISTLVIIGLYVVGIVVVVGFGMFK